MENTTKKSNLLHIHYNIQEVLVTGQDKLVKHYRKMNCTYTALFLFLIHDIKKRLQFIEWGKEMANVSLEKI